ncbi:hypothetical protein [Paraeggerthella sp.]|uniref:hypothetical protein n=1 Tax=unclassified Paraeggerthella TaxID=2641972 RepID=UPI002A8DD734|nr:hypothetical protein [Paraeggerthella sp.]
MSHHTRNESKARALSRCALAACAALAIGCACPSANQAWAHEGVALSDRSPGGSGGVLGGGSLGNGSASPTVEQPYGQIVRIIPGRGMTTILFLPALPIDPGWGQVQHPDLQVLYLDRRYADDPADSWERWAAYTWNEDHLMYETPEGDGIRAVYDDDFANPSIRHCAVFRRSETVDYRDFYLRATAVVLQDGETVETAFEPALITYPEGSRPSDDENDLTPPPSVVNPPETDSGGTGGNIGGVGQGESERVHPEGGPEAPESNGPAAQEASEPTGSGGVRASDAPQERTASEPAQPSVAPAPEKAYAAQEPTVEPGAAATQKPTVEPDAAASEVADEPAGLPGFAWALGLTAGVVGIAGGAIAVMRAKRR